MTVTIIHVFRHERMQRDQIIRALAFDWKSKTGRHDAEHRVKTPRQTDLLPHDVGVAVEKSFPSVIRQNHDSCIDVVVFPGIGAAAGWWDCQDRKNIRSDREAVKLSRFFAAIQYRASTRKSRQSLQRL